MASGQYHFALLNRFNFVFSIVCILFCHALCGAAVQQSFQSSIAGDSSEETSETSLSTLPKSTIEISDPDTDTVWTVSETAKIEWETENIDPTKSIRFFLAKDDMVVQELGSFKNNSLAEDIALAKNVGSGDQYQVVGIELFPANKFQVAKYATSYFSIRNPIADARKKAALAKRSSPDEDISRNEFEGRKISYVKELSFTNENISVSLWDHGRQDGDIVSIYLNGETVVSKHHLTYNRKKVSFKLNPDKTNELFLYAHNLGTTPPNTVSIELTDGSTSEKIILNSDLKSCEAVQIKVKS
ncbi:hypothetical protein [Pricia sp.]|uniref:hypothetical protein n=1 Tax=Pricia sp. TaxID=2268138 RepID=UPI003594312A